MTFDPSIGDGAQLMDILQLQATLNGFSLVDASEAAVTPGTTDLTVDVASAPSGVRLGGPAESFGGATGVSLPTPDSTDPRKALVYLDNTGTVQTLGGDPAAADPSGAVRESTGVPTVPIPTEDFLPLAEVWLAAGATDIVAGDIQSRRVPDTTFVENLTTAGEQNTVAKSDGAGGLDMGQVSFNELTERDLLFDTSLNVSTEMGSPSGIAWNDDGSAVIIGSSGVNTDFFEYTTTEAYDISTASYSGNSFTPNTGDMRSFTWSDDGLELIALSGSSNEFREYTTSTAYDITGLSETATFDVSTEAANAFTAAFSDDGTVAVVHDRDTDAIYKYNFPTPFDISTTSYSGDSFSDPFTSLTYGLAWNDDGTNLYVVDSDDQIVRRYELSSPYDITTATLSADTLDTSPQVGAASNITWVQDGGRLFVSDEANDEIEQYLRESGGLIF